MCRTLISDTKKILDPKFIEYPCRGFELQCLDPIPQIAVCTIFDKLRLKVPLFIIIIVFLWSQFGKNAKSAN